ncbi:hypothetical protein SAMN06297421_11073 [Aristaeella hokkaidonensis]|nr:hypothetical protein SAMN06297421_11073 [Aristaeella hokkaidonensis]
MYQYIKNECNRIIKWKSWLLVAAICLFVMVLVRACDAGAAVFVYSILANLGYVFVIGICVCVATDDFENGTYIQAFTGKYSVPHIIGAKLIAAAVEALVIAALSCILSFIATYGQIEGVQLEEMLRLFGMTMLTYLVGAMLLASVAVLMGSFIKNQGICVVLMFSLFLGVFAEIIGLVKSHFNINTVAGYLLTQFALLPEMMLNGAASFQQIGFCMGAAMLNYVIICCTRRWWLG